MRNISLRRNLLRRVAVVALGAAPALGLAQASSIQEPQGGNQMSAQMGGGSQQQTFVVGTLQGVVQAVDLENALVSISTMSGSNQGRTMTLRARPFELAAMNPGDVVALTYNNYNGLLWLAPAEAHKAGQLEQPQSWSQSGKITGSVQQVNRQNGIVNIRGQNFFAHPQQLEGIYPGQFVSLTFSQVGRRDWVSNIQLAPLSGGGEALPAQPAPAPAQPERQD